MKKKILILLLIFYSNISIAQEFGRADSLRGYLFPERSCYDVTYYHLSLNVDPEEKYIKGFTEIHFDAVNDFIVLQIDLFENLQINRIEFEKQDLKFSREFNAVFVEFTRSIKQGENASIKVHYEGSPRVATRKLNNLGKRLFFLACSKISCTCLPVATPLLIMMIGFKFQKQMYKFPLLYG